MIISPWIIIGAPVLGSIVIGIYRMGSEDLIGDCPTVYSLIYGPLSTLLVSLAIAGILSNRDIESIPKVAVIAVTFISAAILVSVDIAITNNRIIDSILVTLVGIAFFAEVILGVIYVMTYAFPWELVIMAASAATFVMRVVLWILGK